MCADHERECVDRAAREWGSEREGKEREGLAGVTMVTGTRWEERVPRSVTVTLRTQQAPNGIGIKTRRVGIFAFRWRLLQESLIPAID
ncbi:hypothetical protein FKM82_020392 [Ascaphus truei]